MAIFTVCAFLLSCEVRKYYCIKMSVNSTNNKISTDSYLTAAAGAVVSGGAVAGANHLKLKNLADKTVKAFNSTPTECDQFVKKNNEFLTRAVEAKKGFFGKINKTLKGLSNPDEIADTVKKSSSDLIDGYRNNAARKIGTTLEGDKLKKGINELSNKYLSKDIFKSFKNVNKLQNILAVSAAVLLGAVGACAIKEVATRKLNPDSIKNQTANEPKTLPNSTEEADSVAGAIPKENILDEAAEDKSYMTMTEKKRRPALDRTTSEVNTHKGGNSRTPRTTAQVNTDKN